MSPDHAGQMPVFLSSFVGRSEELAQLRSMLSQDGLRLLTLTGPGGSGKTRLAARIALEMAERFEDGLCWVSLEGLNAPRQVPQAVIVALGLVEGTGSPTRLLSDVLRLRQMVLVLDNCEHLVDACAQLVGQLLRSAPDLRILATSRERLNVGGEWVYRVPGMSMPADRSAAKGNSHQLPSTDLLEYDSVRLFVERAKAVMPTFRLTAASSAAISRICRQVDGLPLAVELAAARVGVLGVDQINERLAERLDLLTGGPRTAPDRHATLRATFDWSHDQLGTHERTLFRRLGVFRGSFEFDAAEEVAQLASGAGESDPPAGNVLDLLTNLVEKSLVGVERPQDGRTVFRLLDMTRRYAEEKLTEAGEAERAREAHLNHYVNLALESEPGLKGPEQRLWLQRLSVAHDNLRAALDWAIEMAGSGEPDRYRLTALQMAGALFWFWNAADMFGEGQAWLERTLALFDTRTLDSTLAEGLFAAGSMAWLVGDMSLAWRRLQESLSLFQRLEIDLGVAKTKMMLGRVRLYQGQSGPAVDLLNESVAILRDQNAFFELGLALGGLSAGLAMTGEYDAAYNCAGECRGIFEAIGDPFFLGMALGDLGWAAYHQERLGTASKHLLQALALRRAIDSSWQTAQALVYLAEISRYQHDPRRAIDCLEEAWALAEDVGATSWLVHSGRHLGLLAAADNRWTEAAAHLLGSLARASQLDDQASMVMAVEGLALVAAASQDRALAGLLSGAAQVQRDRIGPPRTPAEHQDMARLVERLSPWYADEVFSAGRAAGLRLPLLDAGQQAERLSLGFEDQLAVAVVTTHRLQIYALGPVDVWVEGRRLMAADWGYAKPKELLFYLVANPPRSKEEIGLEFWPDASPEQLRRNFRATIYHVRQALGRNDWVLYENGRYAFNRALDYCYDVEGFENDVAEAMAITEKAEAIEALARAADRYRGDYVTDLRLDGWALGRRESLRQTFLDAQMVRAGLLHDVGRFQESAAVYRDIVAQDNLQEAAHRGLMRNYARLGQVGRAIRHYQELVGLLADELGIAPDAETTALFEQLQSSRGP